MSNRTMFSDSELKELEAIVQDLKFTGKSSMKIKGLAHQFFMARAPNKDQHIDLATEAWVNAVVQFLIISGYKIVKGD